MDPKLEFHEHPQEIRNFSHKALGFLFQNRKNFMDIDFCLSFIGSTSYGLCT